MKDGKFEVGDIITGVPGNGYGVTNSKCIMKVEKVYNNDMIVSKVSGNRVWSSATYVVVNSTRYFKLIDEEKTGKEMVGNEMMKIKKVIYNGPATIVLWENGTKTVAKCNNEPFDKEKGLAMAISKKVLGNTGIYRNVFKKWCD